MNIKLTMYSADLSSELSLPFADQGVRAGFPSPAQDYMTDSIDLNRELIRHPATTFPNEGLSVPASTMKWQSAASCIVLAVKRTFYCPVMR